MPVSIGFHGAARTVTGSCLLVAAGDTRVLIDCGMFQGSKALKQLNYGPFPFEPSAIDAVLLTHAHIDHSGLVPKLMRDGFTGPVFATHGTRDLSSALLPDAGHIQEFEVEILNRRNRRRGVPEVVPIFTRADGVSAIQAFGRSSTASGAARRTASARGSGTPATSSAPPPSNWRSPEAETARRRCACWFSGDLGPQRKLLERPTTAPQGIDYLFCEATYGNTDRPDVTAAERRAFLASVVRDAVNPEAPLLVPAFAVERTQELLVDLVTLMGSGGGAGGADLRRLAAGDPDHGNLPPPRERTRRRRNGSRCPAFAAAALHRDRGGKRRHRPHARFQDRAGGQRHVRCRPDQGPPEALAVAACRHPCCWPAIRRPARWDASSRKAPMRSASRATRSPCGRASAGPTTTRATRIAANCSIGSRHANPIGRGLFVTHGEESAIAALAARLRAAHLPGVPLQPLLDDVYDLTPAGPRLHSPQPPKRLAPEAISRTDWHNERSRLLLEISASLQSAPDDAARLSLIERLRHAMESTAS